MGNLYSCIREVSADFGTKIKIYRSKRHWSKLANSDSEFLEEEIRAAALDNRVVFKALQEHRIWGGFFCTFGDGELVVGKQFAQGGQAKIYEAQIKRDDPVWRELVLKHPDREYLLKVFNEGTFLRQLQRMWPQGYLQFQAERLVAQNSRRYNCDIVCGTLLADGRFAFLLQREHTDLQCLIERNMKWRFLRPWTLFNQHPGPFPKEVAERSMYEVACGVDWLHRRNIVHSDLKPANVLVREENDRKYYFVADYECSVGVLGTGFYRAPEILQACKDRVVSQKPELFTRQADAYSFGMTCFEILTGEPPFQGHSVKDYDFVLKGGRCQVPTYIDAWLHALLSWCWEIKPIDRPSFEQILAFFSFFSTEIQGISSVDKDSADPEPTWDIHVTLRITQYVSSPLFYTQYCSASYFYTQYFSAPYIFREYVTARCDSLMETTQSGSRTSIEEQITSSIPYLIEFSKSHWSLLAESDDEEVAAEMDNREVFQTLQSHPTWGTFFLTFGDGAHDSGELVIGEKFAEGGQAELSLVHVEWRNPKISEYDLNTGREWVLKVFKKGTLLRYLQSQWPHGMLQFHAERVELDKLGIAQPAQSKYKSDIECGTLLKDGRFAFLMQREQQDLRSLIDHHMRTAHKDFGPFSKKATKGFMHDIALGMDWLHNHNIVHRDLKASNVLVREDRNGVYQCLISDYETSIGVVGTGYFIAPEILQAIKDGVVSKRPELFTKEADSYSYGMTCYEILTGKLPFEGYPNMQYTRDLVIGGLRPELPEYVDDWARELLARCWQPNPTDRPSFSEILEILDTVDEAT